MPEEEGDDAMTARDIEKLIAATYPSPEYATFIEVRNSVGFASKVRSADAMVMSLWPSRGIYMHGYEIKVSKSDWNRELANPAKAEEIAQFCKFWSVVCPDGLIDPDSVPPNWGLVYAKDRKLKTVKYPKEMEHRPPTWALFASLCRDVTEQWLPASVVDERVAQQVKEIDERRKKHEPLEMRNLRESLDNLNSRVKAFEDASGVQLDRYSEYFNREIGAAVKLLRGSHKPAELLDKMRDELTRAAAALESARKAVADVA